MVFKSISIATNDSDIPLAYAENSEADAILFVIPSIFGTDSAFEQHTKNLQNLGFSVYAIDSFWRTDAGPLGADQDSSARAFQRLNDCQDHDCDADVSALLRYIRSQHSEQKIIGLGICFGGRPIVRAALDKEIDAVASWHGIRIGEMQERLQTMNCASDLHFGELDQLVPMAEIATITAATKNNVQCKIITHKNCDHGFTHHGRDVFDADAYDKALQGIATLI